MTAVASTQTLKTGANRRPLALWTGRFLSALPVLAMVLSASLKLTQPQQFLDGWVGKFGYPESAAIPIGLVELACAILYAIPRSSVWGAVLVTGYFGGAIATHVRIGDPSFIGPLILGILAWLGLYLRDSRLQAFVLRRPSE